MSAKGLCDLKAILFSNKFLDATFRGSRVKKPEGIRDSNTTWWSRFSKHVENTSDKRPTYTDGVNKETDTGIISTPESKNIENG